jgi:predicted nucleic acid-binding protein
LPVGELSSVVHQAIRGVKGEEQPSFNDCIIAATAEYNNLAVYTRNEKYFKHFTAFSIQVQTYRI